MEPVLLETNDQLKEFVEKWKQLILKNFDKKQKFFSSPLTVRNKIENKLEKAINSFNKNYDTDFFKKNIIIIDYGGQIRPLGKDKKMDSNSTFTINNLHKIKVEGNQITLEYFSEKDFFLKSEEYAQPYSAIYSLDRTMFGLNSDNYVIKKQLKKPKTETQTSSRFLDYFSYITQDLSRFEDIENTLWDKKTLEGPAKFATIIIKSKSELKNLLEKYSQSFEKKFSKNFLVKISGKIIKDFSDNYFEDNVLVLLSGFRWPGNVSLFSNTIELSYDVSIVENNLKFTVFFFNIPMTLPPDKADESEAYYGYKSNKNLNGVANRTNESHTQFLKLPKRLIKDLDKIKATLELKERA
ncbi:hypothetical protein CJJ23_00460 [Mycoplasmopsis agassizii]|uniref:Uncharacterized protein n=1 Tax=Mycoplasmopsis agassizii TaxID=33922 RepID=A0A269TK60_9BACT|nr:hypothetical protein [Mycoplasmopsis agassizii]PAK21804.1 hypothetical protein CJJ23_00460 [Mycoplasmopsis agassizii]